MAPDLRPPQNAPNRAVGGGRHRLGADRIVCGHHLTSVDQTDVGVHLRFRDRATDSEVRVDATAVIGADGIHASQRTDSRTFWLKNRPELRSFRPSGKDGTNDFRHQALTAHGSALVVTVAGVSIGVAYAPLSTAAPLLLGVADDALRAAKRAGKGCYGLTTVMA